MKTLLFLALPVLAFAQIGAKVQQQGKIHGLWQNSQFGYQMTLMLNPDGSGEFDGEMIRFTTQGNTLAITQQGAVTNYTYTLQGNSLTLTGGDLDNAVTFMRNGGNEQSNAVNATTNTTPTPRPGVNAGTNANTGNTGNGLIGVWSGNGETMEFKPDGTCVYAGNVIPYRISQGHIILQGAQGEASIAYSVNGDQLTLMSKGQQMVYGRGAGNKGAANTGGNANQGRTVPIELDGRWCYVNVTSTNSGGVSADECITLNADGTYLYRSERSMSVNTNAYSGGTSSQSGDRGTWYVEGDRIFFSSQTQGQSSYQLQKRNHPKNTGDPMIVLDGRAYVTATYRQPWR